MSTLLCYLWYLHSLCNGFPSCSLPPEDTSSCLSPSSKNFAGSRSFVRDSISSPFKSAFSINIQIQMSYNFKNKEQPIEPSEKMKKNPSIEELQLVVDHFDAARTKDIEAILTEHEPHVLEHRDKIYAQALSDGITVDSDDRTRLKVLARVVEYTFNNVEPPDEYTKVCFKFAKQGENSVRCARISAILARCNYVHLYGNVKIHPPLIWCTVQMNIIAPCTSGGALPFFSIYMMWNRILFLSQILSIGFSP